MSFSLGFSVNLFPYPFEHKLIMFYGLKYQSCVKQTVLIIIHQSSQVANVT